MRWLLVSLYKQFESVRSCLLLSSVLVRTRHFLSILTSKNQEKSNLVTGRAMQLDHLVRSTCHWSFDPKSSLRFVHNVVPHHPAESTFFASSPNRLLRVKQVNDPVEKYRAHSRTIALSAARNRPSAYPPGTSQFSQRVALLALLLTRGSLSRHCYSLSRHWQNRS